MKKILITGTNSYIGKSLKERLEKDSKHFSVEMVSVRDEVWQDISFEKFDVVIHTAAIVHSKNTDAEQYRMVNIELTRQLAEKAKKSGVDQFVFFSTMGVYGMESGHINHKTKLNPKTLYAKSKVEAENILNSLQTENFKVAILRPPLVYGRGCPGNYQRLAKIAAKSKFFPQINNQRSMIYIEGLTEFVKQIIEFNAAGTFFPQNKNYVNTSDLVRHIAEHHSNKIIMTRIFNIFIGIAMKYSVIFKKVFGIYTYDKSMPGTIGTYENGKKFDYEIVGFEESIQLTERPWSN